MEEFKNLESIIVLCTKELYTGDRNIHATLGFEELKELQNLLNKRRVLERGTGILINKTREQKRTIQGNHILLAKYSQKNEEQEKIIELMVDRLSYDAFYMDDASEYCEVKKKECDCYQNKSGCKECLLDYFKKKVRENND